MLEQSFIIALAVYGWFSCFWEGMIFGGVAKWLKERLPDYLTKPLFACPICMIVWYGIPLHLLLWGWQIELIIVIPAAMGINAMIITIEGKLEDISDAL